MEAVELALMHLRPSLEIFLPGFIIGIEAPDALGEPLDSTAFHAVIQEPLSTQANTGAVTIDVGPIL